MSRVYNKENTITFAKTKDKFGELSNMCSGFPLLIFGETFLTSEALYQALKFPNNPEIQKLIQNEKSPMSAKMVSNNHKDFIRDDWDKVKVHAMRFSIWLKYIQHMDKFKPIFKEIGNRNIVEYSSKDNFWGASLNKEGKYEGKNALGRLLMELRDTSLVARDVYASKTNKCVGTLLFDKPLPKFIGKDGLEYVTNYCDW